MDVETPVLIGAGQILQKNAAPAEADDPIALCARAARAAAEDARGGHALLEAVDTLAVVNILCWDFGDAPRLLAEVLGIHPATRIYTSIGGNTPQALVNRMADRIAAGQADVVLLAGAEAFFTGRAAHRSGTDLGWPKLRKSTSELFGDTRLGVSDLESRHGLSRPTEIYPLFENALRAHLGRGIDEHRLELGRLYAPFTRIAAENPFAWFPKVRTAEEIATPSAENRYVGFPYTKLMNAIMMVDQSAALIMTSASTARHLGVPESRWVYPIGGAETYDHWFVSERPELYDSPAIRAAVDAALHMAGTEQEAVGPLDLYSCFPCAVQIARAAGGLERKEAPPTLTGGLAYFGGAGNNYAMHAIAEAMARVRADRDAIAMATAVGWFMTKHAVGVYSGRFTGHGWVDRRPQIVQSRVDRRPRAEVVPEAEGRGRIESYCVMHDRGAQPVSVSVIGRLEDECRFLATAPVEPATLAALMDEEGVGKMGRVRCKDGINHFTLA